MRRWETAQKLLLVILGLVLFIPACSQGVTSQDYENISNQLKQTQAKVSSLENEKSDLKQQVVDMKKENENLKGEVARLNKWSIGPTASTAPTTAKIIVTYSSVTGVTNLIVEPRQGNVYLIVNMTVENQGYDSFSLGSYGMPHGMNFYVVANNVRYDPWGMTGYLQNYLPKTDVPKGSKATGTLAFEVPAGTTTFSLQYGGSGSYNIQWVKQ